MINIEDIFKKDGVLYRNGKYFIFHKTMWGRVMVEKYSSGYKCKPELYPHYISIFLSSLFIFIKPAGTFIFYLSTFMLIFGLVAVVKTLKRKKYVESVINENMWCQVKVMLYMNEKLMVTWYRCSNRWVIYYSVLRVIVVI